MLSPPQSEDQNRRIEALPSLPNLTHHQQMDTRLRGSHDLEHKTFVPVRLLSCMTMTALFSSVIAACRCQGDEDSVKYLRAIFDWKEKDDVYKTICIHQETHGSFEIFLRVISEAPCWRHGKGKERYLAATVHRSAEEQHYKQSQVRYGHRHKPGGHHWRDDHPSRRQSTIIAKQHQEAQMAATSGTPPVGPTSSSPTISSRGFNTTTQGDPNTGTRHTSNSGQ